MRETGSGWPLHLSSRAVTRSLRLGAVVVSLGLVMAGAARAEDGDDDNLSFEQKAIKSIMTGLGGTNMDNTGIDYRERSPLVVPRNLDLPPPEAAASTDKVANWPKDPDVKRRREAAAAAATSGKPEDAIQASRSLTPAEMAPKRGRVASSAIDNSAPGDPSKNIVLSPSQLGVSKNAFSKLFGGSKPETATFSAEPTRDSLTEPPPGYQTPSPAYAYGTGPKEALQNNAYANPMTGKQY